jgi:hypothetical protein
MTKVRKRKGSTAFVVHNSDLLPKLEKHLNYDNLRLLGSDQNSKVKGNVLWQQGLEIQYPVMTKEMSLEETKEYHLKKLEKLSVKALGEIPRIEEPNEEQKQWVIRRRKGLSRSWEVWDQ